MTSARAVTATLAERVPRLNSRSVKDSSAARAREKDEIRQDDVSLVPSDEVDEAADANILTSVRIGVGGVDRAQIARTGSYEKRVDVYVDNHGRPIHRPMIALR